MVAPKPVSIIIPTLNEEKYLPILLESLCRINHPMEVIIVDGYSDDQTVTVAKSFREKLSPIPLIILNSKDRFIAKQRNAGAKIAKYELLLFCDADIVAPNQTDFTNIIEDFVSNDYAIVTSRISALEEIRSAAILLFIAYYIQKTLILFGKAYGSGAFLLTTKTVFNSIGGFDETLRISEDVDFTVRATKQGKFKIYNIPIKTSMRRVEKYGYSVLYKNPRAIFDLINKGKQTEEKYKIEYPFGKF